ncbi:MAG: hypothetical protein ACPL3P_00315 [Anaerolineales bacterium]
MMENHFENKAKRRIRTGVIYLSVGLIVFLIGIKPALFGLDRSPVIGFVQIAVFLIGLAAMCLGSFITLNALWNGNQRTIIADIGYRLVSTGFVVAALSGMADVFGIGSHRFPAVPYFGHMQAIGVILGQITILIGLILMIPYRRGK